MARNPYYKDDSIRVDLRDSRGRIATLSRAALFYIYVDGRLVEKFAFSKVSARVSEKEAEIREVLLLFRELLSEGIDEPEDIREELEEEYEEEWEPLSKTQQEKLQRELEQDLINILLEEEPSLVDIPGKHLEYDQWIESRSFRDKEAYLEKWDYSLDEPVAFTTNNIDDLENFIETNLAPIARRFYREAHGEKMFIMRLKFNRNIGKKEIESTGIGTFRTLPQPFGVKNLQDFDKLVVDKLLDQVDEFKIAYLLGSIDNKIIVTGFTLENVVDVDINTEEELMDVYSNSLAKAEEKHDQKIRNYRKNKRLVKKAKKYL